MALIERRRRRARLLRDRWRRAPLVASEELENCTKAKISRVIRPARVFGRQGLTVKIKSTGGCLAPEERRTWTAAISRGEALNSL